jgi:dihydrofolate reductase
MRDLIYKMGVSLDGFVAGPDGEIDWSAPDEELHRFHNEQIQEFGAQLCGRRLYETMLYWETADETRPPPSTSSSSRASGRPCRRSCSRRRWRMWRGNATLATASVAEEVARLKEQPGKDLAVGGAGLASSAIKLGLIDEFRLFVSPVVLGGGTPYFPALDERLNLELVETRTFGSPVVYLRYRRA